MSSSVDDYGLMMMYGFMGCSVVIGCFVEQDSSMRRKINLNEKLGNTTPHRSST